MSETIQPIPAAELYVNRQRMQEPKRPLSAYALYVDQRKQNLTCPMNASIAAEIRTGWSYLDTQARRAFEDLAEMAKLEYERHLTEYLKCR